MDFTPENCGQASSRKKLHILSLGVGYTGYKQLNKARETIDENY